MDYSSFFRMVCQWTIVLILANGFLAGVHSDFNGRDRAEPTGYDGFVSTCLQAAFSVFLLWGAGAFDVLFGG